MTILSLSFYEEADKDSVNEVEKRLLRHAKNFNITWKEIEIFTREGQFDLLTQIGCATSATQHTQMTPVGAEPLREW